MPEAFAGWTCWKSYVHWNFKKGKSLKGYIDKGLVEVHNIKKRHEALAKEIKRRGMNHQSPLEDVSLYVSSKVDTEANIKELKRRCPDCLSRMNDICLWGKGYGK